MSTSSRSDAIFTQLSTPGMLIVITLLFAGVAGSPRYAPARPAHAGEVPAPDAADELLTEDPLAILRRLVESRRERSLEIRFALRDELRPASADDEPAPTPAQDADLVLVVRLPTDGLDDEERRMRSRQAVLRALLDGGYEPADDLGHVAVSGTEERVLHESFRHGADPTSEEGRYEKVLVAWSPEGQERPLAHVRRILDALGGDPQRTVLVGPTSTSEMIRLQTEMASSRSGPAPALALRVHSPFATATSRFLQQLDARDKTDEHGESEQRMAITSTIGSDEALAEHLVAELRERIPELMLLEDAFFLPGFGPRLDDGPVHVAVVAEANTPYGSAWLENLQRAARKLEQAEHRTLGGHARPSVEFVLHPFVSPIDGAATKRTAEREEGAIQPAPIAPSATRSARARSTISVASDGSSRAHPCATWPSASSGPTSTTR